MIITADEVVVEEVDAEVGHHGGGALEPKKNVQLRSEVHLDAIRKVMWSVVPVYMVM
jgi:hypothetical protein